MKAVVCDKDALTELTTAAIEMAIRAENAKFGGEAGLREGICGPVAATLLREALRNRAVAEALLGKPLPTSSFSLPVRCV